MKKFPIIYKYTEKGKIQQWQIVVNGDKFYTIEGIKGGKLTTSMPTICTGKNIGKKNETSPEQQALAEASAKHAKKLEKGYALKLEDSGKKYFQPMLAKSYTDRKTRKKLKWVDKHVWQSPIRKFVQPKLDGIRTINEKGTLMSREGKPFVTCLHLLQNSVILDGELYNHEYKDDFNAISSMIKGSKPSEEDIAEAKRMAQMWVYDFPGHDGTFSERYAELELWFGKIEGINPSFVLVPTYEIFNETDLEKYHQQFLEMGYEGTILRMDTKYENKRTKNLIKYKDLIDEEFEIVGYEEGKGGRKGMIGKFILKHDKNPSQTFECDVKGKHSYLQQVWRDRDMYIGKEATVQYSNRTPKKNGGGDVPRFGKIVKLDRKSYE